MKTPKILIILLSLFLFSCGPSQEEINNQKKRELILAAYGDIVEYALNNYTDEDRGHNTSGGIVQGDAVFMFGKDYIKVTYTALQYQDTEIGDLEDLYFDDSCGFSDCSNTYPLSIRGRWNCRTSANGDFNLTVSDSTVYFYIFGDGGWSYYVELTVPSTEYVINTLRELEKSISNL
jgi:hypothetical protein